MVVGQRCARAAIGGGVAVGIVAVAARKPRYRLQPVAHITVCPCPGIVAVEAGDVAHHIVDQLLGHASGRSVQQPVQPVVAIGEAVGRTVGVRLPRDVAVVLRKRAVIVLQFHGEFATGAVPQPAPLVVAVGRRLYAVM